MNPIPVIGRFAPTPSGDLHFGSLISAVGSYLEAKTAGGDWLLRVEDIDPPREVVGSAEAIISDLHKLGMQADGPVLYQSSRFDAYQQAVDYLLDTCRAYPCACSRKDLPPSGIYPGTCRNGIANGKEPRAIRFKIIDESCQFTDRVQGDINERPADSCGDFIIRRADDLFAYQLAVVVDDAFQAVSHVVRGADLLDSTCRQICLQKALGLPTPAYTHLPIALDEDGKKLSKRFKADPVINQEPAVAVSMALQFLGQNPPTGLSLDSLWHWAMEHWNNQLIPRKKEIPLTGNLA